MTEDEQLMVKHSGQQELEREKYLHSWLGFLVKFGCSVKVLSIPDSRLSYCHGFKKPGQQ